jgi:hypothetical protein
MRHFEKGDNCCLQRKTLSIISVLQGVGTGVFTGGSTPFIPNGILDVLCLLKVMIFS